MPQGWWSRSGRAYQHNVGIHDVIIRILIGEVQDEVADGGGRSSYVEYLADRVSNTKFKAARPQIGEQGVQLLRTICSVVERKREATKVVAGQESEAVEVA